MNDRSFITRRTTLNILLAMAATGAASLAGAGRTFGQSWPARPIRIISPISAGSAADTITRTVSEQVERPLGQPVVVENRPGGDGTIAPTAVARSEPDGYTILSHSAALTVVATTHTKLTFDVVRDFAGISPMARIASVLVIGASKNVQTVKELIALASTRPINYASPGAFTQLNTERFLRSAGFEALRIPFKGGPEALTEVVAGRVDFYLAPLFVALPLINSGNMVALAITGEQRAKLLPNVPTFADAGFPKADDNFWIGLFAPVKTPRAIINRLHDEVASSVKSQTVIDKLAKFGAEPMIASPDQFDALVRNQITENAALIKSIGISVN